MLNTSLKETVTRLLPRVQSLSAAVRAGSEPLYLLDAEQF